MLIKKLKLKQNQIEKKTKYDEKDKNIVNIYHQDADFDLVFSSIQNKSKLIDWRKQKYANLFKKEVDKVKNYTESMLKSLVYELQNEVKNKGQNFNFIKDYSWDNIMKTMKLYDLHWVNNRSEKIKTEDLSKLKNIISWDSQFSIIAECFYGSYSSLWDTTSEMHWKSNLIRKKIMERHNTIKYLIDNLHLDTIESKTYIKHLFEFLKLKSEKKDDADFEFLQTHYDSKNNIKFKELKKYPFENAFGTIDTITRIETLLKWNEMTSSPKLLMQSSFSSIFGFKIVSIRSFYGKYLCIKYNSCIDQFWTKFELGRTYFNENKIQLTSYLKAKIESEVKSLIPVLVAKFYWERFINNRERK